MASNEYSGCIIKLVQELFRAPLRLEGIPVEWKMAAV